MMKKKILGLMEPIALMEVQIVLEVVVLLKNHQRNQLQDVAEEILEI